MGGMILVPHLVHEVFVAGTRQAFKNVKGAYYRQKGKTRQRGQQYQVYDNLHDIRNEVNMASHQARGEIASVISITMEDQGLFGGHRWGELETLISHNRGYLPPTMEYSEVYATLTLLQTYIRQSSSTYFAIDPYVRQHYPLFSMFIRRFLTAGFANVEREVEFLNRRDSNTREIIPLEGLEANTPYTSYGVYIARVVPRARLESQHALDILAAHIDTMTETRGALFTSHAPIYTELMQAVDVQYPTRRQFGVIADCINNLLMFYASSLQGRGERTVHDILEHDLIQYWAIRLEYQERQLMGGNAPIFDEVFAADNRLPNLSDYKPVNPHQLIQTYTQGIRDMIGNTVLDLDVIQNAVIPFDIVEALVRAYDQLILQSGEYEINDNRPYSEPLTFRTILTRMYTDALAADNRARAGADDRPLYNDLVRSIQHRTEINPDPLQATVRFEAYGHTDNEMAGHYNRMQQGQRLVVDLGHTTMDMQVYMALHYYDLLHNVRSESADNIGTIVAQVIYSDPSKSEQIRQTYGDMQSLWSSCIDLYHAARLVADTKAKAAVKTVQPKLLDAHNNMDEIPEVNDPLDEDEKEEDEPQPRVRINPANNIVNVPDDEPFSLDQQMPEIPPVIPKEDPVNYDKRARIRNKRAKKAAKLRNHNNNVQPLLDSMQNVIGRDNNQVVQNIANHQLTQIVRPPMYYIADNRGMTEQEPLIILPKNSRKVGEMLENSPNRYGGAKKIDNKNNLSGENPANPDHPVFVPDNHNILNMDRIARDVDIDSSADQRTIDHINRIVDNPYEQVHGDPQNLYDNPQNRRRVWHGGSYSGVAIGGLTTLIALGFAAAMAGLIGFPNSGSGPKIWLDGQGMAAVAASVDPSILQTLQVMVPPYGLTTDVNSERSYGIRWQWGTPSEDDIKARHILKDGETAEAVGYEVTLHGLAQTVINNTQYASGSIDQRHCRYTHDEISAIPETCEFDTEYSIEQHWALSNDPMSNCVYIPNGVGGYKHPQFTRFYISATVYLSTSRKRTLTYTVDSNESIPVKWYPVSTDTYKLPGILNITIDEIIGHGVITWTPSTSWFNDRLSTTGNCVPPTFIIKYQAGTLPSEIVVLNTHLLDHRPSTTDPDPHLFTAFSILDAMRHASYDHPTVPVNGFYIYGGLMERFGFNVLTAQYRLDRVDIYAVVDEDNTLRALGPDNILPLNAKICCRIHVKYTKLLFVLVRELDKRVDPRTNEYVSVDRRKDVYLEDYETPMTLHTLGYIEQQMTVEDLLACVKATDAKGDGTAVVTHSLTYHLEHPYHPHVVSTQDNVNQLHIALQELDWRVEAISFVVGDTRYLYYKIYQTGCLGIIKQIHVSYYDRTELGERTPTEATLQINPKDNCYVWIVKDTGYNP